MPLCAACVVLLPQPGLRPVCCVTKHWPTDQGCVCLLPLSGVDHTKLCVFVCVCVCVCVTNHWQRGCAYSPVMSRVAVLRTYLQVVWKEARARVVGDERLRDKIWESTGQLTAQIAHNEQAAKAGVLRSY